MKTLLLFKDLPSLRPVLNALGMEAFPLNNGILNGCAVKPKDFDNAHVAARLWCSMILRSLRFHLVEPTPHKMPPANPWDPVFTAGLYPDSVQDGSAYGLTAQAMLGTDWRQFFATGATTPSKNAGVGAQSR